MQSRPPGPETRNAFPKLASLTEFTPAESPSLPDPPAPPDAALAPAPEFP